MKALALVESPDHVCGRYRVRAFAPALEAAGWALDVEGIAPGLTRRMGQFHRAGRYDAVILQRKLLSAWQLLALRRRARRLIFDFDDAVLYRDSYDPRGPFERRRSSRFVRTVGLADVVLAGNDFLAECAEAAGAPTAHIRVIPTCIDVPRYRPMAGPRGDGLDLVWIGSSSTLNGLELQRPLWERIGRELPGVRLRLICDRFARFDPLPVEPVPWAAESEAEELARSHVGISWVPDDRWSRGKCGLKVLQYQAAGLPVVTNPVGVHPRMVEPGVSGFLPESPEEWVESLRALIDHPDLRERMGREARASVEARYSVDAWAGAFVAAVTGSASAPSPGPAAFRRAPRLDRSKHPRPRTNEPGPAPHR
jgi:glycosyltransferase involved in cell wall biosynthesis